jgi:hypothetical protein
LEQEHHNGSQTDGLHMHAYDLFAHGPGASGSDPPLLIAQTARGLFSDPSIPHSRLYDSPPLRPPARP